MRWRKNIKPKERIPDDGEERIINKFLWSAKEINHECRWLEYVRIRQKYHSPRFNHIKNRYGGEDIKIIYSYWEDIEFVD